MGDKTKDNIAKNLERLMEENNMNREEFAKAIGVPYTTVCNWFQKVSSPRSKTLEKITEKFNVSIGDLVNENEQPKPSYRMYPVLGEIANGYDSFAVQEVIDKEAIPEEWVKGDDPDKFIVLQIKGDSNYPELRPGSDRVLIHLTSSVESGSLAAVIYDTEYATIKRVIYKKGEDWLELHALNPNYPPIRIEGADLGRCRVIGEVVRLIRKY